MTTNAIEQAKIKTPSQYQLGKWHDALRVNLAPITVDVIFFGRL